MMIAEGAPDCVSGVAPLSAGGNLCKGRTTEDGQSLTKSRTFLFGSTAQHSMGIGYRVSGTTVLR